MMRKILLALSALALALNLCATGVYAQEYKNIVTSGNDKISLGEVTSTYTMSVPCAIAQNSGTTGSKNVIINRVSRNSDIVCHSDSGMSEFNIISYDSVFQIANIDKLESTDLAESDKDYDIISAFSTKAIAVEKYANYNVNKIEVTNYASGDVEDIFFVVDENMSAVLSPQSITVDGKAVSCTAYNIMGNNYLKLRDLASVLSNTGAKFNVWYDEGKNAVCIKRGSAYAVYGLSVKEDSAENALAKPNYMSIYVDNKLLEIESYNIEGYTYYKLRDLSQIIGFSVEYDETTNNVAIVAK